MPVIEVPVRARTRRRVRTRLPAVLVIWTLAVAATVWVASSTRIGPVVEELNSRHGIHLFDVVMALVVTATATLATWELLRPRRDGADADGVEPVAIELRRIPLVILGWLAATGVAAWASFETQFGPVLVQWNRHRALRAGDLVITAGVVLLAGLATVLLLRPGPEDR